VFDCSPQFDVIAKFMKGAFCPTAHVGDENVKKYWSTDPSKLQEQVFQKCFSSAVFSSKGLMKIFHAVIEAYIALLLMTVSG